MPRPPVENSNILAQQGAVLLLEGDWRLNDMGYVQADHTAFLVTYALPSPEMDRTSCTVQWLCGDGVTTGSHVARIGPAHEEIPKPSLPLDRLIRTEPTPPLRWIHREPVDANPLLTVDWDSAGPTLQAEIRKHVDRWRAAVKRASKIPVLWICWNCRWTGLMGRAPDGSAPRDDKCPRCSEQANFEVIEFEQEAPHADAD